MEIILIYFLLSIMVTYIVLYLLYPKPEIILKHPTIHTEKSDLYIDDNDVCYKYHRTEVGCPMQ